MRNGEQSTVRQCKVWGGCTLPKYSLHFSHVHVLETSAGRTPRTLERRALARRRSESEPRTSGPVEGDRCVRRSHPPLARALLHCCFLSERSPGATSSIPLSLAFNLNRPLHLGRAARGRRPIDTGTTSPRGARGDCGVSDTGGYCLTCFCPPLPKCSPSHALHSSARAAQLFPSAR